MAELVFLTFKEKYQNKGYGGFLLNIFKDYLIQNEKDIFLIVACADDNAVDFFKKNGFQKKTQIDHRLIDSFTKTYEGS